jgi:hypothetical protein
MDNTHNEYKIVIKVKNGTLRIRVQEFSGEQYVDLERPTTSSLLAVFKKVYQAISLLKKGVRDIRDIERAVNKPRRSSHHTPKRVRTDADARDADRRVIHASS